MRRIHAISVCAFVFLAVPLSLAQEAPEREKKPATPAAEAAVAAVVNGEKIYDAEVAAAVQRQVQGRRVNPETQQKLRSQTLEFMIDTRLVEKHLESRKIRGDAEKLDAFMKDLNQRVLAAGLKLEDVLSQQGLTEAALRQRIAGQLAFEKYAAEKVNDAKIEDHFAKHKSEFDGTEVRASHLLIKLDAEADKDARDAAVARINAIRKEIAEGLEFDAAARKYSQGPSGPKGGDLGFFPRHQRMVEPFAAAAFALKKGEISEPVETQFGLHLIQVTDLKPGTATLTEARDDIKALLTRELWEQTAAQERNNAKIEIRGDGKEPASKGDPNEKP